MGTYFQMVSNFFVHNESWGQTVECRCLPTWLPTIDFEHKIRGLSEAPLKTGLESDAAGVILPISDWKSG